MTQAEVLEENRGKLRQLLRVMPLDRWIPMVFYKTAPPLPPTGPHCRLSPAWYAKHARKLVARPAA